MIIESGLIIGAVAGWKTMSSLGKSEDTKFHLWILFAICFSMLLCKTYNHNEEIANFILVLMCCSVIPGFYLWEIGWKELIMLIFLHCIVLGATTGYGIYQNSLNIDLYTKLLQILIIVLQFLSMLICPYFVVYGYSKIPELLLSPALKHIFKQNTLETSKENILRAKSNIAYNYACRGLSTPKFEQANLKTIQKQLDIVETKIFKLSKRITSNRLAQASMITSGCYLVSSGFWIFSTILGIFIERIVISNCAWSCGFEAESKIVSLFSNLFFIIPLLISIFILISMIIGYMSNTARSWNENPKEILLGLIFLTALNSFSIQSLLTIYYPKTYKEGITLINLFFSVVLSFGSFLFFIYWNFMKCKDHKTT
ncbi:hypothetical protein SteCoe_1443 [Stentor coeruleus]|uniref:Uncharacterized protein n=1 Tax=Stentor coeruleus TaxID=5963 RepID=A0A1R2D1X2_9CILI|nr:hypothetical protein SteCoe_1443 [Stentor coeruleus]